MESRLCTKAWNQHPKSAKKKKKKKYLREIETTIKKHALSKTLHIKKESL